MGGTLWLELGEGRNRRGGHNGPEFGEVGKLNDILDNTCTSSENDVLSYRVIERRRLSGTRKGDVQAGGVKETQGRSQWVDGQGGSLLVHRYRGGTGGMGYRLVMAYSSRPPPPGKLERLRKNLLAQRERMTTK